MRLDSAVLCILLSVPRLLTGQQSSDASQAADAISRDALPPSAVLQTGLESFDRIRSDMANWSDIELAAFAATITAANADCIRIEQTPHEGDEELALAKLCALGKNWDGVYSAARWYTRSSAPAEQATTLTSGYALLIQADLNLQAVQRAVDELKEMQARLPFTLEADAIFTYAVEAMEVSRPEFGLRAAQLLQPDLLAVVNGSKTGVPVGLAEAQAWHTLVLLHAAGLSQVEATEKAKLLEAIAHRTAAMSAVDQYQAQHGRIRYEWLGRQLPPVPIEHSTYATATLRQKASPAKATLLVVQGSAAPDVATLSLAVDSLRTRLAPGTEAKLILVEPEDKKAEALPRGVHAQTTRKPLLSELGYESGPLFITLDVQGKVTWLSTGTPSWFNPQQPAEALLQRTLEPEPLEGLATDANASR